MTLFFSRLQIVSFLVLGGALAAGAATGCSPLALSTSKLQSGKAGTPSGDGKQAGNPTAVTPIEETSGDTTSVRNPIRGTTVSVRELREHQKEIGALPSGQLLVVSADDDAESLDLFKTSRALQLQLKSAAVGECKAYFGLNLSATAIENFGWNTRDNAITIDCVPQSDGLWNVSVSDSVSIDEWNRLSPFIASVSILIAEDLEISVAGKKKTPKSGGHPMRGTKLKPVSGS